MQVLFYVKNITWELGKQIKLHTCRALRELGLKLNFKGSRICQDVACFEPLLRHRTIVYMEHRCVAISPSAYLASNSSVMGDVFIGQNSYLGFGSIVDAKANPIRIGRNTKIGDGTTVSSASWVPDQAFPLSTTIANDVNIEQNCNIFSAIIDDGVNIGFNTIVMEGAQLERGCVIAPNSHVPAGSRIPENTLWAGTPVKFVKNLAAYQERMEEKSDNVFKIEHNV